MQVAIEGTYRNVDQEIVPIFFNKDLMKPIGLATLLVDQKGVQADIEIDQDMLNLFGLEVMTAIAGNPDNWSLETTVEGNKIMSLAIVVKPGIIPELEQHSQN